jgi:hypothetical protein
MGGVEEDDPHACVMKPTDRDANNTRQVLRFIAQSLFRKEPQTGANVTAEVSHVNMD